MQFGGEPQFNAEITHANYASRVSVCKVMFYEMSSRRWGWCLSQGTPGADSAGHGVTTRGWKDCNF